VAHDAGGRDGTSRLFSGAS